MCLYVFLVLLFTLCCINKIIELPRYIVVTWGYIGLIGLLFWCILTQIIQEIRHWVVIIFTECNKQTYYSAIFISCYLHFHIKICFRIQRDDVKCITINLLRRHLNTMLFRRWLYQIIAIIINGVDDDQKSNKMWTLWWVGGGWFDNYSQLYYQEHFTPNVSWGRY